jgi:tetratricopeptide (TPR) repeat protein
VRFFGKKNVAEKVQAPNVSEEVLVVKQKESDPVDDIGWHNRGVSFSKSFMFKEANECYNKALEMNPENAEMLKNKATNLFYWAVSFLGQPNGIEQSNKKLEDSLEFFSKTLQINPNSASAWRHKGIALSLLNRYSEVLECFDKGLALEPKDIALLRNKGIELHRQNRLDEAIACFAEILSVDPRNAEAKDWVRDLKKRQNKG